MRLRFPFHNRDGELTASSGVKTRHNPSGMYSPAQTKVWNIQSHGEPAYASQDSAIPAHAISGDLGSLLVVSVHTALCPKEQLLRAHMASLCEGVPREVKALCSWEKGHLFASGTLLSEGKARGPAVLTVITSRPHLQAGPCCFSSGKRDSEHSQQLPGFERLDINDWHPVGVRHSARHWENVRAQSQPVSSLLAWSLEREVLR